MVDWLLIPNIKKKHLQLFSEESSPHQRFELVQKIINQHSSYLDETSRAIELFVFNLWLSARGTCTADMLDFQVSLDNKLFYKLAIERQSCLYVREITATSQGYMPEP